MSELLLLAALVSGVQLDSKTGLAFDGLWKAVRISRGPVGDSMLRIKQAETTIALYSIFPGQPGGDWVSYPTDGKVTSVKRRGHRSTQRSARWDRDRLILETIGEGNAPWRRSKTTEVLSLSDNRNTLTAGFRFNVSKLDYDVVFQRVQD